MGITLVLDVRNARLEAIRAALDDAPAPGTLKIFTAPRPATGASITSQIEIATLTFSKPCGNVVAGTLVFAPIAGDPSANHTVDLGQDLPLWGRFYNGYGATIMDANVSAAGGGGDIILSTLQIVAGGSIGAEGTQVITEGGA
ncbi:hypothetical protein [Geoalkalibacter sp.]|uniref:hypothetical protein n=1 Tax=Geoalkalibacter sp. TaxID=3041440 RepID=UPI00272EB189|nr:hypothetical protein [Geoalkalibacter sp.]